MNNDSDSENDIDNITTYKYIIYLLFWLHCDKIWNDSSNDKDSGNSNNIDDTLEAKTTTMC